MPAFSTIPLVPHLDDAFKKILENNEYRCDDIYKYSFVDPPRKPGEESLEEETSEEEAPKKPEENSNTKFFKAFRPICHKSKNPVYLVLRSSYCEKNPCCRACIYSSDFLTHGRNEKFRCKRRKKKEATIDQLYIDLRLSSLITAFLEGRSNKEEIQKLMEIAKIGVNQQSQLYVKVDK